MASVRRFRRVRQFGLRTFLRENFPDDEVRREMMTEIEVDSLAQLGEVLAERPDIVLLDNMTIEELRRAVSMRDEIAGEVELEASGGVFLATVRDCRDGD